MPRPYVTWQNQMEKSTVEAICVPLYLIGFPLMWVFFSAFLAQMGGWSTLAEKYQMQADGQLEWHWFKSLILLYRGHQVRYRASAMMGYANDGLGLDVLFPFKFQHPKLFVPRSEIKCLGSKKYWWLEYETFGFSSCPTVVLGLFKKDGVELKKRLGL